MCSVAYLSAQKGRMVAVRMTVRMYTVKHCCRAIRSYSAAYSKRMVCPSIISTHTVHSHYAFASKPRLIARSRSIPQLISRISHLKEE
jgi:hypothetical protein